MQVSKINLYKYIKYFLLIFAYILVLLPSLVSVYGWNGLLINSILLPFLIVFTYSVVARHGLIFVLTIIPTSLLSAFPLYPNWVYWSERKGFHINNIAFTQELYNDPVGTAIYYGVFLFLFIVITAVLKKKQSGTDRDFQKKPPL
jgi:hypothetical protein